MKEPAKFVNSQSPVEVRSADHPLRIACCQFNPKLKDVAGNTTKVTEMLAPLRNGSLDLVVLPEMCLTGYMFESASEIHPYLENNQNGPTATLSKSIAHQIGCWVVAGYPERANEDALKEEGGVERLPGYNSAILVSPAGQVVGNYRKSFLFDTDKTWAREGSGFQFWDCPPPLGRAAMGICMDMNPKDFVAPWEAYELSKFAFRNNVDTLIVPMNWLAPPGEPPEDAASPTEIMKDGDSEDPELSTINYWAHRLQPLHDGTQKKTHPGKTVVFVSCNRCGEERGTTFVGSSSVMTLRPGRVVLHEAAGRGEEKVIISYVSS